MQAKATTAQIPSPTPPKSGDATAVANSAKFEGFPVSAAHVQASAAAFNSMTLSGDSSREIQHVREKHRKLHHPA